MLEFERESFRPRSCRVRGRGGTSESVSESNPRAPIVGGRLEATIEAIEFERGGTGAAPSQKGEMDEAASKSSPEPERGTPE